MARAKIKYSVRQLELEGRFRTVRGAMVEDRLRQQEQVNWMFPMQMPCFLPQLSPTATEILMQLYFSQYMVQVQKQQQPVAFKAPPLSLLPALPVPPAIEP
jgi:hypothetical protein